MSAALAGYYDPFPVALSWAVTALVVLGLASLALIRHRHGTRSAEQEARYRAVVDSTVDPILVIDERGRVVSFNPAAERAFGYAAAEVVGSNVSMLVPAWSGIDREVTGRRKDGSIFPLERSVAEWRANGCHYYAGIMRDITERNRADDALRQANERAERADKAKGKFLAAASHDLRQPVQSLFFFAHALSERLKEHPTASVVASMSQSLDALRTLLDSLLDVSRLDAGVVQPSTAEFALAPLLDRLARDYQGKAAEKGLAVRIVATSAWTRSDAVLLERLLRNLLENAVRYTSEGGVLLGCRRRGAAVEIQVVDTGIGIPEEQHNDVFEDFFQMGNPERDRRHGLGLGLAIVQRLARLLGHRIELRSLPGRGSLFAVTVPAVAPNEVLPQPRSATGRRVA